MHVAEKLQQTHNHNRKPDHPRARLQPLDPDELVIVGFQAVAVLLELHGPQRFSSPALSSIAPFLCAASNDSLLSQSAHYSTDNGAAWAWLPLASNPSHDVPWSDVAIGCQVCRCSLDAAALCRSCARFAHSARGRRHYWIA